MYKLSIYFESEVTNEDDEEVIDKELIEEILAPFSDQSFDGIHRHIVNPVLRYKISSSHISFNFSDENSNLETVFVFESRRQLKSKVEQELVTQASIWAGYPGYFGVDGLEVFHNIGKTKDAKIYGVKPCRHACLKLGSGKPYKITTK